MIKKYLKERNFVKGQLYKIKVDELLEDYDGFKNNDVLFDFLTWLSCDPFFNIDDIE